MYEPFFLIGLILVTGFVANLLFDRTRISQVLILIALGFLIGPVLHFVDAGAGSPLAQLAPFVGALALIILLFDGGITLNIFDLVRVLPKTTAFTLVVFIASVALAAGVAVFAFNWPVLYGILLGAAVGGTSSAIVIALASKSGASGETRTLLSLESALTDVLCIVSA